MTLTDAYPGASRDLSRAAPATRALVSYLASQTAIVLGSSLRDDPYPDHRQGAVDLMTTDPAQQDRICDLVIERHTAGACRIISIITRRRRWTPAKGWHPYTGASPHLDHVHVWIDSASGFGGGGTVTPPLLMAWPAPTTRDGREAYYGHISGPATSRGGSRLADRPVISRIQSRLRQLGFSLSVDGVIGDESDGVIRWWQRTRGLRDDGLVGRRSWAALQL